MIAYEKSNHLYCHANYPGIPRQSDGTLSSLPVQGERTESKNELNGIGHSAWRMADLVGAAFSRDKRYKKKVSLLQRARGDENGIYTTWMLESKAPVVLCALQSDICFLTSVFCNLSSDI